LRAIGHVVEARAALGRAVAVREELAAAHPAVVDYQSDLGAALHNLSLALPDADWAEQVALLERAVACQRAALRANPHHPTYRQYLAFHPDCLGRALVTGGRVADGARSAEESAALRPTVASDALKAAVVLTQCVTTSAGDAAADGYGTRAVAQLREAVRRGFKDRKAMAGDPDLAPLRARDDFRALLAELPPA
jgi:hypothetical protein